MNKYGFSVHLSIQFTHAPNALGSFKEIKMTRQVIKTAYGFTVYGAFTCIMRLDASGAVTYSNMNVDSQEYRAMFRAYKKSI
jgi:hypothetical protein